VNNITNLDTDRSFQVSVMTDKNLITKINKDNQYNNPEKNRLNKYKCPLCSSEKTSFFVEDYWGNYYFRCSSCELVFLRPIVKGDNDKESWTNGIDADGNKRDLTKDRDFKIKNWYGDVVKYLKQSKPGKIIDIGCGLGYLLSSLPDEWEKYGYEISSFGRSFIKENFSDINIVDDLQLDEKEPAKTHLNKYDFVVCYHVIEHIKYPGLFMKNMVKLLKAGGVLIIGTPNMGSIAAKKFKGNFRLFNKDHISMFNRQNLEWLLEQNNLKIFRKEYPFFKTDYFTFKNFLRLFQTKKPSPPFYGSIMTMYAEKDKLKN